MPMNETLESLADAELVARCRAGSQVAWRALVTRFQRLIYTVPRRAGLDDDAAGDVFQATFTRLFEHLERLQQPERVQAWLVTTARRETLRWLAERSRPHVSAGSGDEDDDDPLAAVPDPSPLPDALLDDLQQQHRLRRALERLDERSRTLLELLFLADPSPPYAEIAARLGMPEGSIGPTRARALQKLRALLQTAD
jgi:RNA polymerase sigma factor (sigma-70 family)